MISPSKPLRASAAACGIGLALCLATPATAQSADGNQPFNFVRIVDEKLPAVVGILSTGPAPVAQPGQMPQLPPGMEQFFGTPEQVPRRPMQSQGSGFIISADGYVVTNNHVISGAETIEVVTDDDTRFDATLVGTDPATDIALLKVESEDDLPSVAWGRSQDLDIGEWVVAIGNPFGLGGTVTAGIVSARARNINSGPYDDFIQTDAAINRGNSGGPLFNTDGDVVGVNTAIFSPTGGSVGIGFSVPSRVAQSIVEDLRDDGKVQRGWLGVQIQPMSPSLAEALGLEETSGALVANVTPGGPADAAGLQSGDVILSLAGEPIETPRDLTFAVAEQKTNEAVNVTILRDGEESAQEITIGLRPEQNVQPATPDPATSDGYDGPRMGVSIAPLTTELRQRLGLPPELQGLVVQSVAQDSAAARAQLRPGDVIVEAASEPVTDIETLRSAVAAAEEDDGSLLLRIFRAGGYAYVAVRFGESDAEN